MADIAKLHTCHFCDNQAVRLLENGTPICDNCIDPSDLDSGLCCVECGSFINEGHEADCLRNPRN